MSIKPTFFTHDFAFHYTQPENVYVEDLSTQRADIFIETLVEKLEEAGWTKQPGAGPYRAKGYFFAVLRVKSGLVIPDEQKNYAPPANAADYQVGHSTVGGVYQNHHFIWYDPGYEKPPLFVPLNVTYLDAQNTVEEAVAKLLLELQAVFPFHDFFSRPPNALPPVWGEPWWLTSGSWMIDVRDKNIGFGTDGTGLSSNQGGLMTYGGGWRLKSPDYVVSQAQQWPASDATYETVTETYLEAGFYVTHKWLVAFDVWFGDANQQGTLMAGNEHKPNVWGNPPYRGLQLRQSNPITVWANSYQIAFFTLGNHNSTGFIPGFTGFQGDNANPESQIIGQTNMLIGLPYVPPRQFTGVPFLMVYGYLIGTDFATGTSWDMTAGGIDSGIAFTGRSPYHVQASAGITHLRFVQWPLLTHSGKPVMQNAWVRFADSAGEEAVVRGKLWDAIVSSQCPEKTDQYGQRYPARGATMAYAEQRWVLAGGRVGLPHETQGGVWLRLGPVTDEEALPEGVS